MPVHLFSNSFTTGEITDQLIARTNWEKYANAAACLKNFVVRPYGGAARRAGTIWAGAVKDPSTRVRLVKFEFNIEQAYVLEFGNLYIRVWANRAPFLDAGGVHVEVASPYLTEDLRALRFEQSADVLYIAHPDYAPRKLQRTAATVFELDVITFNPPPTFEEPVALEATLSLTSAAVGSSVAIASTSAFYEGDVGRQISSGAGRAVITVFTSTTQVGITILDAFSSTGPITDWTMDGSANAGTLTISSAGPVNSPASFTSSLNAFRSYDVDAYIYAAGGIAKIYEVSSATVAHAIIVKALTGTPPITTGAGAWTLERPAWSDDLGYPGVVALYAQRLWWAGSPYFPDRIFGSIVADYENMGRGVADDEAVDYQLAMSGVNLIRWMKALPEGLGVGTIAGEVTLNASGSGGVLTPTNVQVVERTVFGADYTVDAIRTSNLVLFLQRGAQRLRELTTNPQSVNSEYVAPDLTILAEQLSRAGLVEIDRASSPESLVFAITAEGVLNACSYERPENVIGWSHHETQGLYESLVVIPNQCGTGDEVWVSVNRTTTAGAYFATGYLATGYVATGYFALGGDVARRGLEIFDGSMNTDAGLVYSGVADGTFTGLDHLEGLTVKAITAEGTVYDVVVADGAVTLPDGATTTSVEVGLHYTSTLQTLRPELQGPQGTAQARRKRWAHVTPRVYCTHGRLLLNGVSQLEYPEGVTVSPSAPYTGDLARLVNFGWNREGQLTIQTLDPKPCTILALTGGLELDDA